MFSQRLELGDLLKEKGVKKRFDGLKKQRILTTSQYEILYPEPGIMFQEDRVDITLWVLIARQLIPLKKYIDWNQTPGPFSQQDKWPHHMLRYVKRTTIK